jgi:hypothetical protein
MIFAQDLTVRGMTGEEMDRVSSDTATMRDLAKVAGAIRLMPKLN